MTRASPEPVSDVIVFVSHHAQNRLTESGVKKKPARSTRTPSSQALASSQASKKAHSYWSVHRMKDQCSDSPTNATTNPSTHASRLETIPQHLRIRILYSDDSIVVLKKPSLLRSVPGNIKSCDHSEEAPSQPSASPRIQQAWFEAIRYYNDKLKADQAVNQVTSKFSKKPMQSDSGHLKCICNAQLLLNRLASKSDSAVSSIPRRNQTFKGYISRNIKTILPHLMTKKNGRTGIHTNANTNSNGDNANQIMMEEVSQIAYEVLSCKALSINMQQTLSKRTIEEDSALGQLQLLAHVTGDANIFNLYGKLLPVPHQEPLHVVHRLDCETSGVMVFARNVRAASVLSKAWRERDSVSKIYHARVQNWPPFHKDGQRNGVIDLALAPMENERLKWHVKEEKLGGKPSQTIWSILDGNGKQNTQELLTLELKPVTGRTHQLRVHCATIGSGIIGDSLYGDNPIPLKEDSLNTEEPPISLRLHAHKLSFPHPEEGNIVTFECNHRWLVDDRGLESSF